MGNKLAIVTGASGDIGKVICESLIQDEFSVVGIDLIPVKNDHKYTHVTGPVESITSISEVFTIVKRFKPDFLVLVNNAGITLPSSEDIESWNKTILINLTAPYMWMSAFANYFEEVRCQGRIISVTSLSAELSFPNNPSYAASKGGLKQLTKAFGYRLGELGICCNNVGPGYIETKFNQNSLNNIDAYNSRKDRSLLKRWGLPIEVAKAISFLASDGANFITCQDIYVDGGWISKGI